MPHSSEPRKGRSELMTAIMHHLARYWLTETRSPSRRRLGKIAACVALAGLSIAGGTAFSGAPAEAQGSHGGYTYTQRVCQEYGQQPRRYYVRDEMAGSDWRSDGGWAIVLERGITTTVTITFGAPTFTGGAVPTIELATPRRVQETITDNSGGAYDGVTAFQTWFSNGAQGALVVDQNNDGQLTISDDRTAGPSSNQWQTHNSYSRAARTTGGSYIRWADMRYCR